LPVYRDDERAVTERIEALERAIAARQRLLTPFVRERLPEALRDRISVHAELPPDEEPVRRADDLTAHLEALEEAVALVPRLREDLLALPGGEVVLPRQPPTSSRPLLGDVSLESDRTRLTYILMSLDAEAAIWIDGTADYGAVCAALQPEGEPLGLIVTLYRMRLVDTQLVGSSYSAHKEPTPQREPEGQAWTRLAPGTPRLEAYPQGLKETLLLKPLGLRRDVQVGDPDLDGELMFDADEDVARTLIVERVRRGLLAVIAGADRVRLSIEDSAIATLTWDGETDERVLRGAVDVLVGLRLVSIEPLLDARGL
jgi:hypothetical protein